MNPEVLSSLKAFAIECKAEIIKRNRGLTRGKHLEVSDGPILVIMTCEYGHTSVYQSIRVSAKVCNESTFNQWIENL